MRVRLSRWAVVAAVALAWLGYLVHNLVELPGLRWWSPESLLPALLYIGLGAWCAARPASRAAAGALLAWALLQLVGGGIVSVLPLPFLPFEPAQTPQHYAVHAGILLTHAPLVALLARHLRAARA